MIWYCLGSWAWRFMTVARLGAGRSRALAVVASSASSRRRAMVSCRGCGDDAAGSAAVLFVEMAAVGGSHCYLLLLPDCAATDALLARLPSLRQMPAGQKLVCLRYSMHAKSNRPRPSRALVVRTDASSRNRPCPHQSPRLPMPTPTLTAAVGPSGHAGMVVRLARAA